MFAFLLFSLPFHDVNAAVVQVALVIRAGVMFTTAIILEL